MSGSYKLTVGLEIHAELKTRTKMFCNSLNNPDEERPNVNVCPICMGHPGTLPAMNKEAVKQVIRVGLAAGGNIADYTEFDRKNYFYPDIPKGYQISQYEYPLVSGGEIAGVELTRIHLEEDTAQSTHHGDKNSGYTLVNFNRAGVPLMELVTEPVITSAEQAGKFAKELRLLLQTLGAGEANMEKGEMRVEANISVSKTDVFGTKVEVKNLNSFRAVEGAIAYEFERQVKALEVGEEIVQETRGWDEGKQATFSQRKKEGSADYRYFPEPDLPKLKLSEHPELSPEVLKETLPELPWKKRERYVELGISDEAAEVLVNNFDLGGLFDTASEGLAAAEQKTLSNYLTSDLVALMRKEGGTLENLSSDTLQKLVIMIGENKVSSRGAKDLLAEMYVKGGDPEKIAEEKGLLQVSDEGAIEAIAQEVIGENPIVADEYKSGKEAVIGFLVGQGMKKSKGSANPQILQKIFKELLS